MAAGAEFLAARVQKMEALPAEERPCEVACYLEAYRLLDAVAEALPMPTAQQVQVGGSQAGRAGSSRLGLRLLCVALLQPVHTCVGLALHPQAGARTADGWAPPPPTPAVPPDALVPALLRFLGSRYVLRSSVAAHPANIDTTVCLQLGGLLDVTRLRVTAGGAVQYSCSCGDTILVLGVGHRPDDSPLTLLKALCASALMMNDSA